MTKREMDIFIVRGLIGITRMIDQREAGGFPRMAKDLVHGSQLKIEQFMKDVMRWPVVEEYDEVDEKEFKRWLLQGLTTLSEFVERLAVLGGNDKKVAHYRELGQQMRLIIQSLSGDR